MTTIMTHILCLAAGCCLGVLIASLLDHSKKMRTRLEHEAEAEAPAGRPIFILVRAERPQAWDARAGRN
jgi:hypothetical protein